MNYYHGLDDNSDNLPLTWSHTGYFKHSHKNGKLRSYDYALREVNF